MLRSYIQEFHHYKYIKIKIKYEPFNKRRKLIQKIWMKWNGNLSLDRGIAKQSKYISSFIIWSIFFQSNHYFYIKNDWVVISIYQRITYVFISKKYWLYSILNSILIKFIDKLYFGGFYYAPITIIKNISYLHHHILENNYFFLYLFITICLLGSVAPFIFHCSFLFMSILLLLNFLYYKYRKLVELFRIDNLSCFIF